MAASKARVVICCSHGKSHMSSALDVSRNLSASGLPVTVLFPNRVTTLSISDPSSFTALGISLISLDDILPNGGYHHTIRRSNDGLEMSGVRIGLPDGFELAETSSCREQAFETFLTRMEPSPTCVIVDVMLGWTEKIIHKLGYPRFVFFPGTPTSFPMVLRLRSLFQQGVLPIPHKDVKRKRELLDSLEVGLPMKFRYTDIPDAIIDDKHTLHDVHMSWTHHILSSDGVIFNTFIEFEPRLVTALAPYFHNSKLILTVGPLFRRSSTVFPSPTEKQCKEWLDSQPAASVVYVSFGSYSVPSREQVHELAMGLELSKHRFLWVLQDGGKVAELPPEFVKRNSDRILVVSGWAPQQLILGHSATGAFLTHCGWNSTLECVTLGGIPMICWPFMVDQPPNARHLVDGVKIAVDVQGDELGLVSRDEVLRAVQNVLEGAEAEEMRKRAKVLQVSANRAVEEEGSSHENLELFVSWIRERERSVATPESRYKSSGRKETEND